MNKVKMITKKEAEDIMNGKDSAFLTGLLKEVDTMIKEVKKEIKGDK